MAELVFDALAAQALEHLLADPTRTRLADRLEAALDRLEVDPGDPRLGREEFKSRIGLVHGTRVQGDGAEWLILWRVTDRIWVHYVGPAGSL